MMWEERFVSAVTFGELFVDGLLRAGGIENLDFVPAPGEV
jgi:hypothetical protein